MSCTCLISKRESDKGKKIRSPSSGSLSLFPVSKFNSWNLLRAIVKVIWSLTSSPKLLTNVPSPSNPSILGYDNNTYGSAAHSITVVGNYAYVSYFKSGLGIVDISDPSNIALTDRYDTARMTDVFYESGDYAYATDSSQGLHIFNVSNVNNIGLSATLGGFGSASSVAVSGNYAYVTDGANGLKAIDISDKESPTLADTFSTTANAGHVEISGNYAYVQVGDIFCTE